MKMSPSLPEKIGRYTISALLGRGAMGLVYAGRDPVINRIVAIKVIRKSAFADDELSEALDRFKREAQAAGQLSHPNIVMVYEYGEEKDTAYIGMEYVSGRTLKEIMEQDNLTIGQVQDFMVQLLDGLDYAHTHRVTHRDIKPANLVYTDEGQIKIMDFGIARVESSSLTQVGTVMGTPAYMAPELFTGEPVDHRTDLFAAGVILYQLLTGIKPFTGSTMSILMHQVVNIYPPHPSEVNPSLPKILDTLLRKSLSKQLADRFQSAAEFKQHLLKSFNKIPSKTKIPRQTGETTSDPTRLNKAAPGAPPPDKGRSLPFKLTPRDLLYGGILLFILLLSLFFAGDRGNDTPPEQAAPPSQPAVATTAPHPGPEPQAPVKIISPESKKVARSRPEPAVQPEEPPSGISINRGRQNRNDKRSGTGISITTPRRD